MCKARSCHDLSCQAIFSVRTSVITIWSPQPALVFHHEGHWPFTSNHLHLQSSRSSFVSPFCEICLRIFAEGLDVLLWKFLNIFPSFSMHYFIPCFFLFMLISGAGRYLEACNAHCSYDVKSQRRHEYPGVLALHSMRVLNDDGFLSTNAIYQQLELTEA